MRKAKAIAYLGGTVASAAQAVGVSYQAVARWPDPLPQRIAARIVGVVAIGCLPGDAPAQMLLDLLADEQPAEAGQGA